MAHKSFNSKIDSSVSDIFCVIRGKRRKKVIKSSSELKNAPNTTTFWSKLSHTFAHVSEKDFFPSCFLETAFSFRSLSPRSCLNLRLSKHQSRAQVPSRARRTTDSGWPMRELYERFPRHVRRCVNHWPRNDNYGVAWFSEDLYRPERYLLSRRTLHALITCSSRLPRPLPPFTV